MKSLFVIILFFTTMSYYGQNLNFDENGKAETTIYKPELKQDELFGRVAEFIQLYYWMPKVLAIDPDNKTVLIEGNRWDVLNRKNNPSKKPVVSGNYKMEINVVDGEVIVKFQHLSFYVESVQYYLSYKDLITNKPNKLIYSTDKEAFEKSYLYLVNLLKYYIENKRLNIEE